MVGSSSGANDGDYAVIIVTIASLIITLATAGYFSVNRAPTVFEQRLMWDAIMEKYEDRVWFRRHLRMRPESFTKLLSFIRDDLEVNQSKAASRGGAILPKLRLYCTIRWLSGASYIDIVLSVGISPASSYWVVSQTIHAIVKCPFLQMKFPQTEEECIIASENFAKISRSQAITNCVGVCDVSYYYWKLKLLRVTLLEMCNPTFRDIIKDTE